MKNIFEFVKLHLILSLLGAVIILSIAFLSLSGQITIISAAEKSGLEKFTKDADTTDIRENREIGFGAKRVYLQNRGYWVTAIEFENRIVALNVRCPGSGPDAPAEVAIRNAIANAGLPNTEKNLCYYEFEDAARLNQLQSAINQQLGKIDEVTATSEIVKAHQRLTSPFSLLTVGTVCGYDATKPEGLVITESLVKAKQVDLLRSGLRSINPEGRVYAALGLLMLAEKNKNLLSTSDLETIEKIRSLTVVIESCSGCMPDSKTADQLILLNKTK